MLLNLLIGWIASVVMSCFIGAWIAGPPVPKENVDQEAHDLYLLAHPEHVHGD